MYDEEEEQDDYGTANCTNFGIIKSRKRQNTLDDDRKDFYDYFVNENALLSVKIDGYEIKQDSNNKQYTAYQIQISTMDPDYSIEKRYSEFYELKDKIKKKYPKLKIDGFPHKRLFGELKKSTIEKRQSQLDAFLGLLNEVYKEERMFIFLDFLGIYQKYSNLGLVNLTRNRQRSLFEQTEGTIKYETDEPDEIKYLGLLEKLKKQPEAQMNTFNQIGKFFFEEKPKLSGKLISLSLSGSGDFDGLIAICGEHEGDKNNASTHLKCGLGINLLNDMMSFSLNLRAELFQDIFKKTKWQVLKKLNFPKHVLCESNAQCKQGCLKLLHTYLSQVNQNKTFTQLMVQDQQVIIEYEKWIGKRHATSQQVLPCERRRAGSEEELLQSNNNNMNNKNIQQINIVSEQNFMQSTLLYPNPNNQQLLSETNLEQKSQSSPNQKKQQIKNAETQINKPKIEINNASDLEPFFDHKFMNWTLLFREDNIKVKTKKEYQYLTKISITLNHSAQDVYKIFFEEKDKWDNQLQNFEVLEDINQNSKFIKQTHIWERSSNVNFITELMHTEIRAQNQCCIYQTQQPIQRDIKLENNKEFLGQCLTMVRIQDIDHNKDRDSLQSSTTNHKESQISQASYQSNDITAESLISNTDRQMCKIKIIKKPLNNEYFSYYSPLILGENNKLIQRYKTLDEWVSKMKKKSTIGEKQDE